MNIEQAPLVSVGFKVDGEAVTDGLRGGVADVAALYLPPPKPPRERMGSRAKTALRQWWARQVKRWRQVAKAIDAKRRIDEWRGRL